MFRKSITRKRYESKAKRCAAMRAAKERKRLSAARDAVEYAGTVRYIQPTGKVRQVVIRSTGLMVYVDGGPVKTYRAFCQAINRKLWGMVTSATH
jgi:hypothetical protein